MIGEGLKLETLMEISGDKGVLSGGVRVSEESKVLTEESNRGTVIGAIERKSVESGNLGNMDRHDVSKNRTANKVSRNEKWESWGVMNMVGRVLGGKLYSMDDEVDDVSNYRNQSTKVSKDIVIGKRKSVNRSEVNLASDVKTCRDVIEEPISANGVEFERSGMKSDSVKLDLGCTFEGSSLSVNQDFVSSEQLPDRKMEPEDVKDDVLRPEGFGESEEVNVSKADMLKPKGCEEQDLLINEIVPDIMMEAEEVNDVKSECLIPNECGEEAEKEGGYKESDLVWGKVKSHPWWPGQIFAPSAASDKAKKYFKKDSYFVGYFGDQSFAWNDGSKLMPFRKHYPEMVKQSNSDGFCHAVNCTLDEITRRVEFGLSCPCWVQEVRDEVKFQVVENTGIREELIIIPGGDDVSSAARFSPGDVLQFLESLAKGPRHEHDGLQFTIAKAQLRAHTRWKGYDELPVFEACSGFSEDDTEVSVNGEGNDSIKLMEGLLPCPVPDAANDISSNKRKSTAQDGSSGKRKQVKERFMSVLMSTGSSDSRKFDKKYVRRKSSAAKNPEMATSVSGSKRQRIDSELDKDTAQESQIVEIIPAKIPTPDLILSSLILAAKMPLQQGQDAIIPLVDWLREFRNSICTEKSSLENQVVLGKHEEEQQSQTADILGFGCTEDSYWRDRIIQTYSQPETDVAVVPNLDDNKEREEVLDLDARNEVSEEFRPTALILNFKNMDSIPSIKDLNEIFSRYGSLEESETKILSKSKRVKVIFKRPSDAETAFSSARKYSVFGPSLVSHRLHYTLKPQNSQKTSKKKKKKKDGKQMKKEGTSQNVDAV